MRYLILLLFFCLPVVAGAQVADRQVGLYSTLPQALFFKIRLKAEYDFDRHNAIQLMYSRHWNGFYGDMAGAEYRRYSALGGGYQWFGYAKAGWGNFTYKDNTETPPVSLYMGTMEYAGAGLGIRLSYNAFCFDFGAGLKAVTQPSQQSKNVASGSFFDDFRNSLNPGGAVDVNIMMGFVLWSHKPRVPDNDNAAAIWDSRQTDIK